MKRILFFAAFGAGILLASCGGADDKKPNDSAKQAVKPKDGIPGPEQRDMYYNDAVNTKKATDSAMRKDPMHIDARMQNRALTANMTFANYYPKDSMAAECLFNAAGYSQAMGNYKQAASLLETILSAHKDYKRYPTTCYILASIYDMQLSVTEPAKKEDHVRRAKELYQFIIDKYPNSIYTPDCKILIKNAGNQAAYDASVVKQSK